ncbi:hypothetical protein GS426_17735 [Rhodococcus hoagii]|nr:hypothetical protein [Prescottella equi]
MTSADEDLIQQMRRLDGLHDTVDLTAWPGRRLSDPVLAEPRRSRGCGVRDLGTG